MTAPAPDGGAVRRQAGGEADRYIVERLLAAVRDDIGRADTKASILLSGVVALPALLLGGRAVPDRPGAAGSALLAFGGLLWAAGGAGLVRAILPRTGTTRTGPGVTYFADLVPVPPPQFLLPALAEAGRDPVRWLLTQTLDVSGILAAKYRWIRRGVTISASGALLCSVGLMLA